jgi:hypothetical protein
MAKEKRGDMRTSTIYIPWDGYTVCYFNGKEMQQ